MRKIMAASISILAATNFLLCVFTILGLWAGGLWGDGVTCDCFIDYM